MKKALFTAGLAIALACTANAQAGIGIPTSQIDPSAQLQVSSTAKGFLPPVMTEAQRNDIANPAQGLIVFCTDCGVNGQPQFYNGSSWRNMLGGETAANLTTHSCGTPNVHNPNLAYGTMTDQEGNEYKTIVIGNQEWMAENLNTSIYRNGDMIPTNLADFTWENTNSGAWAYWNNDASYACPYGKLYNWFTCVDARHLCPVGWHMPTDAEWTVLTDYLGGVDIAGGKMKTTGLWSSPNDGATNSSGFSGTPGGFRYITYNDIGSFGYWWSSSATDNDNAMYCNLFYYSANELSSPLPKRFGLSVRCIRD